jgi:hypothetical protein
MGKKEKKIRRKNSNVKLEKSFRKLKENPL